MIDRGPSRGVTVADADKPVPHHLVERADHDEEGTRQQREGTFDGGTGPRRDKPEQHGYDKSRSAQTAGNIVVAMIRRRAR